MEDQSFEIQRPDTVTNAQMMNIVEVVGSQQNTPFPSTNHLVSTFAPPLADNSLTPPPFSSAQSFLPKDNLDMKLSSTRDEHDFRWVNATSKNGKAFRVGYPRTEQRESAPA